MVSGKLNKYLYSFLKILKKYIKLFNNFFFQLCLIILTIQIFFYLLFFFLQVIFYSKNN